MEQFMKSNEFRGSAPAAGIGFLIGAAIALLHFLNGATETSWAPHVPAIQRALGLSDGGLGLALAGLPVGLILGGVLSGLVIRVIGSRAAIVVGAIGFWGSLPIAAVAQSQEELVVALVALGLGNGIYDVGWAVQSTSFEHGKARRYHVLFQTLFSAGSSVGALTAAAAIGRGIAPVAHLGGFAAVAFAVAVAATMLLPRIGRRGRASVEVDGDAPTVDLGRQATSPLGSGLLWLLVMLTFLGTAGLGVAYVWSTPYLDRLGVAPGAAANALIAFTITQGVGQLIIGLLPRGWRIAAPATVARAGLVCGLAGAVALVATDDVSVVIGGFALLGLGIAPFPSLPQSVAAERFGQHPHAMAVLTIAGYLGVLGAPVLIGPLSDAFGLRVGLGAMIPLLLLVSVLGPRALRAASVPPQQRRD
jgi:MFS family permease